MYKIVFFFLAIAFNANLFGQTISVPYRVGNKFGISDQNGKMIIEPQFDKIVVNGNQYINFDGYKFDGNKFLSSYIYNNKIVLKDKQYHSYHLEYDLILARKFKSDTKDILQDPESYSIDYSHLYDIEGNPIIKGEIAEIYLSHLYSTKVFYEIIIHTINKNKLHSLLVYDVKLKKVTASFIENSLYYVELHSNDYSSTEYIYEDKNKKGKRIKLQVEIDKIVLASKSDYVISDLKGSRESSFDVESTVDETVITKIKPLEIYDTKKIDIKYKYNSFIKGIEEVFFQDCKLSSKKNYILEKDGKKGMFFVEKDKLLIPQEFDEILKTYDNDVFVLKKDNKYGLFIFDYYENVLINPVFDKLALFEKLNYFGENNPLIKLYDENNKFFCFADKTGKLFYSEK